MLQVETVVVMSEEAPTLSSIKTRRECKSVAQVNIHKLP
jgi:hypothetical protein